MTISLHKGENVHIIVFDKTEEERVKNILQKDDQPDMSKIDFHCMVTDDVWIRDNGPIFTFDKKTKELVITDWRFNGWGGKEDYWWSNGIPDKVGGALGVKVHSIPMVLEGGSIEVDGRGTLMAKRSCILNENRNPGWKQRDVEEYFRRYFGVTNFIWLNGAKGGDLTDDHIDCTARFANGTSIVTTQRADFEIRQEYDIIAQARDATGQKYKIVHLPLTKRKVRAVQDYGTYVNYYAGNKVVLVPSFDDPNDSVAASILQTVYPNHKVVSINSVPLYKDGGLIHCVTQPQPAV